MYIIHVIVNCLNGRHMLKAIYFDPVLSGKQVKNYCRITFSSNTPFDVFSICPSQSLDAVSLLSTFVISFD